MSVLSFAGVVAAFGFVLLLLGVCLAAMKRFTTGRAIGGGTRVPMEVVQRLSLGPKQGIALVRVGEKVMAVSMGEGGVRPLFEVGEGDRDALLAPREEVPAFPAFPGLAGLAGRLPAGLSGRLPAALPAGAAGKDFRSLLRSALRSAAVAVVIASAAAVAAPATLSAQAAVTQPSAARPEAAPPTAAAVGRVDTSVPGLAPEMDLRIGKQGEGGLRLSGTVGIVVMMGLMTLLPTLLLMMTSFTRILIVLHFLKQALGAQTAPPGHLIAALALLLTGFVMAPTFNELNRTALEPWMDGRIDQSQMLEVGVKPFRAFMMEQTRDRDLHTFVEISATATPRTPDDVPLVVLMSAFVVSELRTAFQIGFALFLPFIVIDFVVASVLMSMGMFMLPPAMISLPFKLLLFVLVDGWSLVIQSLVASFR